MLSRKGVAGVLEDSSPTQAPAKSSTSELYGCCYLFLCYISRHLLHRLSFCMDPDTSHSSLTLVTLFCPSGLTWSWMRPVQPFVRGLPPAVGCSYGLFLTGDCFPFPSCWVAVPMPSAFPPGLSRAWPRGHPLPLPCLLSLTNSLLFSCIFYSRLSSQIFSSKRNFFRIHASWKPRY